jgi:hypothetical protein
LPDVTVKTSKFLLHLQESSSIRDGRVNLQPVSYDLRISEQPGNDPLGVSGDFPGIKIVKRFSITVSLPKDGGPAQSCLCTFQDKKLK